MSTVISVKPVVLAVPGRGDDLQVRVSAPRPETTCPSSSSRTASAGRWTATPRWRTSGPPTASWSCSPPTSTPRRPASPPRTPVRRTSGACASRTSPTYWTDSTSWQPRCRASPGASTATASPWPATPGGPRRRAHCWARASSTTPALIVAGDNDRSHLSTRGPDWFTDPYTHSPGHKSLLTLFGAEHSLGGIPGYEVAETTDESPARVALIQQLTTAFLRRALDADDTGWRAAVTAPEEGPDPLGRLRSE